MNEVRDLLDVIRKQINNCEEELVKRKKNIHSDYFMAKVDIKIIENFEDHKETLKYIKEELEELQKRIVKRNRGE